MLGRAALFTVVLLAVRSHGAVAADSLASRFETLESTVKAQVRDLKTLESTVKAQVRDPHWSSSRARFLWMIDPLCYSEPPPLSRMSHPFQAELIEQMQQMLFGGSGGRDDGSGGREQLRPATETQTSTVSGENDISRRRLTSSSNTASIKYDGKKIIISDQVWIDGDLNVSKTIKFGDAVVFMAHPSFETTVLSTVGDIIPFDTATLNIGGAFDTSTYMFTAPYDGVYSFSCHVVSYNGDGYEVGFFKNNVFTDFNIRSQLGDWNGVSDTILIALAAGDTMSLAHSYGTSYLRGSDSAAYRSRFMGHLVMRT